MLVVLSGFYCTYMKRNTEISIEAVSLIEFPLEAATVKLKVVSFLLATATSVKIFPVSSSTVKTSVSPPVAVYTIVPTSSESRSIACIKEIPSG